MAMRDVKALTSLNTEVDKMLRSMHKRPEKFLTPSA